MRIDLPPIHNAGAYYLPAVALVLILAALTAWAIATHRERQQ